MNMDHNNLNLRLLGGSTMTVCGPSRSGKTHLVCNIIKNRKSLFNISFKTIIYVYGEDQELLQDLRTCEKDIIFTKSLLEADKLVDGPTLLLLDDQLISASGTFNEHISRLYIEGSHHRNIFVILLLQNLFTKNCRLLMLNSVYLAVTKSPRDISSIVNLAKQFCPRGGDYLVQAYKRATERLGGYLFFDFSQTTPDHLRVRNSVFIDSDFEIFVQSDGKGQTECTIPK
jgi:hypothetical protein